MIWLIHYAHGFIVFWFDMSTSSMLRGLFISNLCLICHIPWDCFTGIGVIAWLPKYQRSKPQYMDRISVDIKVHGANMGPTWVLSAPFWPHEPCYQGVKQWHTACMKVISWMFYQNTGFGLTHFSTLVTWTTLWTSSCWTSFGFRILLILLQLVVFVVVESMPLSSFHPLSCIMQ